MARGWSAPPPFGIEKEREKEEHSGLCDEGGMMETDEIVNGIERTKKELARNARTWSHSKASSDKRQHFSTQHITDGNGHWL